ncbi:MAG: replication-associated recombination protein A [Oscillospiraceae bacterium]|nr:replication-associated recombination protein A [Oscillospiraceae bacterium]MBQ3999629.1 replication-associated recombination protein A [Oscillospiraceae bacterium]MBQ5412214.1 replication-associated recombination protein A [Oscillospiraceae bacterium]
MERSPLASLLRPETLDDVFGQHHLLDRGMVFREAIESGSVPNMIFYGPSGVGKTTVANIIAKNSNMQLYKLNGTSSSISDIKQAIEDSRTLLGINGVLIYLDEIQYFNKKQQQSLLEVVENGDVTLIASTTENPYFYVYNALLSRCTVFEFKAVDWRDTLRAVDRALEKLGASEGVTYTMDDDAREHLARSAGGDIRRALNALDFLSVAVQPSDGVKHITLDQIKQVTSLSYGRYDKEGDEHFDLASALMKSLRGSDPDAAVHYLVRFLEAGDIITPSRRLLCSACEDIGLAHPQAIAVVNACVQAAMQLGLPEAYLPLTEAAIYLATLPKSNSVTVAFGDASADYKAGKGKGFPRAMQNVHYDSAEVTDKGQHYLYPHAFENHWVKQQYLPDDLVDRHYYVPGDNRTEQAAKAYWDKIKDE